MVDQGSGKLNFVVEASNIKVIKDCMKITITDGDDSIGALIQMHPAKPYLDLRKVGKPYGTETKYLLEINDFRTFEQNGKTYV